MVGANAIAIGFFVWLAWYLSRPDRGGLR